MVFPYLLKRKFGIRKLNIKIENHYNIKKKSNLLSPCCFEFKGTYYLYYSISENIKFKKKKNTQIYLSKSIDLINWQNIAKPIVNNETTHNSYRSLSPSIIKCKNYFYIFFEARNAERSTIMYGISNNLENWTIKEQPVLVDYSSQVNFKAPHIQYVDNKILIFHSRKNIEKESIYYSVFDPNDLTSKLSEKKILSQTKGNEEYGIYSPTTLTEKNTKYILYAAWSKKPIKTHFLLAESTDLKSWRKISEEFRLQKNNYNITRYSEPSLMQSNNKVYIFFEGYNSSYGWELYVMEEL